MSKGPDIDLDTVPISELWAAAIASLNMHYLILRLIYKRIGMEGKRR